MRTLLQLTDLHFETERKLLFDIPALSVAYGDKIALMGLNGSGKTTLFQLLTRHIKPQSGILWQPDDLKITYLQQNPILPEHLTVMEAVRAFNPHVQKEQQLRNLETRLSEHPELLDQWDELHQQYEREGGYTYEHRAKSILFVLDLGDRLDQLLHTLSGGEKTRFALALALLDTGDLLLLDEPTNHLDIRMREWLESRIKRSKQAVIVVSHDRALLDQVAQKSWYIDQQTVQVYPGGYTKARLERAIQRKTLQRLHQQTLQEKLRLTEVADQQSVWGSKPRPVRSRVEHITEVEAPQKQKELQMFFSAGDARAPMLLWGRNLTMRYGDREVIRHADLKVRKGDRIMLVAPNGTGKTTLMEMLLGKRYSTDPQAEVRYSTTRFNYLDQEHHGLLEEETLREQFMQVYPERTARTLLGQYGLGWAWEKTPLELSGGERVRAGLALIAHSRADLLFLDEPTNHLDIETLESLERALNSFQGACIIVTHDRAFARNVGTRFWTIEEGVLKEYSSLTRTEPLDPFRELAGDPPPPPPPPTLSERINRMEDRMQEIAKALLTELSQREEGRLRSERHHLQQMLFELYAEKHLQPNYDFLVRDSGLKIASDRHETGITFTALNAPECPALIYQEGQLTFTSDGAEIWFRRSLVRAALVLLFEKYREVRVKLPEGQEYTRKDYLQDNYLGRS
ncbi:ABC-F family ATP-binding cassette domain-containing protein [Deinococcus roseus]|uniref:ABC transporter ATP-binding protein n=1 Tax=Deinococcus roseus TaxID=392414 RepID=A0ABQ2CT86_9DEIO|nr:ABC-F family ATP-binding cassette domain-containing protein [Deinococcus roseus]GGJ18515.1 ABC transporter ATP-binding protein [Deinococcus roseus]